MRPVKKTNRKPRKKFGTRIFKWFSLLLIFLIMVIVFLLPAIVSSEKSRQFILAKINNSIAGRTHFTDLSVGWLKGIRVKGFSFDNDTGQISVRAGKIATTPQITSILSGNFTFGQTLIDKPTVEINLQRFQERTTKKSSGPAPKRVPKETAGIALVTDIVVNDGSLRITDRNARTVEATKINSKLNLRPPGQQSSFNLNMAVAGKDKPSTIRADGRITPGKKQAGWSLKGTTGNVAIEVNDLDLESLAPFLALGGIDIETAGLVSGDAKGEIKDGQLQGLTGKITANDLDISGSSLKGDRLQTRELDIDVKLSQKDDTIAIENLGDFGNRL